MLTVGAVLGSTVGVRAEEPVDWEVVSRIRDEGFRRSQVSDVLRTLTDRVGPRLTGSPGMREANEWTRDRLAEWGLKGARLESWGHFGRGWSFGRVSVHTKSPRRVPIFALPMAWTPGTQGAVVGVAMLATLEDGDDLLEMRGKVRGRVLLLDELPDRDPRATPELQRYSAERLDEIARFPVPPDRDERDWRARGRRRLEFRRELNQFLVDEGVVATLEVSSFPAGIVRVGGAGSREPGESVGVTRLVTGEEHYSWIYRLTDEDVEVEMEIDVEAEFHAEDLDGYNTVAEIPGGELADEVVMLGAHLDSWHGASGSNDNAAGCVAVMEAVRILTTLGAMPRRTIRIALWSGEEQGLLGSTRYVAEHFGSRPVSDDPDYSDYPARLRPQSWPLEVLPDHAKLSAYYNLDNGSGKIRGIYTQPFEDLGADTVSNRDTGSTDHVPFDRVGLPGFQFIQDRLDYQTRTHHSNLDHFDHAVIEDIKQSAVILASFVYHTAMRDELLPREALPASR